MQAKNSNQPSLIGKSGFLQIAKESKGKPLTVFEDKKGVDKSIKSVHVQTERSGDHGSVTDQDLVYFKDLAEKRREALDESLKENESLVTENDELKLENTDLKSKNESLRRSVEKAQKVMDMLGVSPQRFNSLRFVVMFNPNFSQY